MVLPRHQNVKYIDFNIGCYFGVEDIVGDSVEISGNDNDNDKNEGINIDNWIYRKEELSRVFTVMVPHKREICCELLTFKIESLEQMSYEFLEAYEFLMDKAISRLQRMHKIKIMAINHCVQNLNI